MVVGVVFYSDNKIALELNLLTGELNIPKIILKDMKQIKKEINNKWNIECEDYHLIKEFDEIKYILVGEWENRIKSKHGFKMIWFSINKAINKTIKKDNETLTFLKNNYREVLLPNHEKAGIATKEECIKHNLITRNAIFVKNKEVLTYKKNNLNLTFILEMSLGEQINEIEELENIKETKYLISKPRRMSLSILNTNDLNLTFPYKEYDNLEFKHINELKCPIISELKAFFDKMN
jgi:hypothetical protein